MKRRTVVGAIGLILLAGGCTEDPLAGLRTGPARLMVSATVLSVNVDDSVSVTATAVDDQGNPLPDVPTAASTTPAIVSVSTASGAPLPQARFFVKGVTFGAGNVDVKVGSVTKSIKVQTYPASVVITGNPDSLGSGTNVVLTAVARSATNQPVAGVTPTGWTSDDESILVIAPSGTTATATGQTPGVASVTVEYAGGVSTTIPVLVVAAAFNGSLSAPSGNSYDLITATAAGGGPAYDADMAATLGTSALYTNGTPNATTFQFMVPPGISGAQTLTLTRIGPNQLAQRIPFTINASSLDDPNEPANDNPATAPAISASGDYFITLHGDCDTPPGGIPSSPSDDCDDFFTITNATAAPISVSVRAEWHEGGDVDILWCNAACTAFVGNFTGATTANPENSTVTVPAATTFRLYMNLFDGGGDPFSFVRLRVTRP